MKVRRNTLFALFASCGLWASAVSAHEVRPGYLQVTEEADHGVTVLWKQPVMGDRALRLAPRFSNRWLNQPPTALDLTATHLIKKWERIPASDGALEGVFITVEGLEHSITDVLVSIRLADGRQLHKTLAPNRPSLQVSFGPPPSVSVPVYLLLGIEHILTGIDHLMFVLILVLLLQRRRRVAIAVTAFTVAHSITLAGTALGLIQMRAAVVEAVVALSIVFVAAELVHAYRGRTGLTCRYPWLVPFAFGLLHGFAFAGALADIGLPPGDIPLSLFLFNVGVEIGQLMFIIAVAISSWLLTNRLRVPPAWTRWTPPYVVGGLAAFWLIERILLII